jgi:hypothetical protein
VRRCGHERLARELGGRGKIAVRAPLEVQPPAGQRAARGELRARLVGHGAGIVADHHAAVAPALQRDDAEQIVERILHVRAVARRRTGGDPVLA